MLQDGITFEYSWLHLPDHNPFSSQTIYRTPPTSTQGYYVAIRSHSWFESYVVVPFASLGCLHFDSPVLGILISYLIYRRTSQTTDTFDPYSRGFCLVLSVFNHAIAAALVVWRRIVRKDKHEFLKGHCRGWCQIIMSLFETTGVAKSVFWLDRGPLDPDLFVARLRRWWDCQFFCR